MTNLLSAIFVPSTDSPIFYFWAAVTILSFLCKMLLGKILERKYKFQLNAPKRYKLIMLHLSVVLSIALIIIIYSSYSAVFKYIDDRWLLLAAKADLFLITLSLGIGPTINSFWLFLVKHSGEITDSDNFKEFMKSTSLFFNIESFCMMLSMLSLLGFFCILAIGL